MHATWQDDYPTMVYQSLVMTISEYVGWVYILFTLWRLESALGTQSTGNEEQYLKGMKSFMRPVATLWLVIFFPLRQVTLNLQVTMKTDPTFLPWLLHFLDCLCKFRSTAAPGAIANSDSHEQERLMPERWLYSLLHPLGKPIMLPRLDRALNLLP
jgi:hypothetical protein